MTVLNQSLHALDPEIAAAVDDLLGRSITVPDCTASRPPWR